MKKCPKCYATYGDDMSFCLNDGSNLVADIPPATVMFNPPVTQSNDSPPTVVNIEPHQTYPPPQLGQQPSYGQPTFGTQAPPPARTFGVGRILVILLLLFIGFMSILGGLGAVFMYSRSKSTATTYNTSNYNYSNYNSTSNNRSTTTTNSATPNTSTYDQDTSQTEIKNGFNRISIEDVTARGFFPGANKTSAATFEEGSHRVVSFASAYDSPSAAQTAFTKRIADAKTDGSTVTEKATYYAYYHKGSSYSVTLYIDNKLYEYSTNNQQVLYRFAKK